jgi:hypothetical protein
VKDGKLDTISLTTTTSNSFNFGAKDEQFSGPLTSTSTGVEGGVGGQGELTMKVYPDSPHFDQVVSALKSGDVATATKLAYADSELIYRHSVTSTSTPVSFNHDIEGFGVHVAGAHLNVTHTEEVSDVAYVKYPNSTHIHSVTVGN